MPIDAALPSQALHPGAKGAVSLVGAGDPDLLTVQAIKAIRRASVLVVDGLVGEGALRYARRSARVIHVGKRWGCASTPQAFIHKLMISEARRAETCIGPRWPPRSRSG